jgi:5-methyltetrahydrofolate--homocysteine methyltransferase
MTFDTHGHTMMGVSPTKALETMSSFGLAALGANCGNGPAEIEGVIQTMRSLSPDTILIAKSNAGLPHWVNEELHYDGTPEVMADYTQRVFGLGAQLIGGCCGSSPAHIKAMGEALATAVPPTTSISPTTTPNHEPAPSGRQRRHRRRS